MTAGEQLTTALAIAKKNQLINVHILIRRRDDIHNESEQMALPVDNAEALRGVEVWLTDHNAYVAGMVGDHNDGRKNIIVAI